MKDYLAFCREYKKLNLKSLLTERFVVGLQQTSTFDSNVHPLFVLDEEDLKYLYSKYTSKAIESLTEQKQRIDEEISNF